MLFAVSNIAWAPSDRLAAYARLRAAEIAGLEIAPGLLFDRSENPFSPTPSELAVVREEISRFGLSIVSMQSLLYGMDGAKLFGDAQGKAAFAHGLERAITLAERLEVPNLVLGSPKQRVQPEGMGALEAMDQAVEVLSPLADTALAAGTKIAVECNPAEYGTNFLTTPDETLAFVRRAAHPAITLNFDVGAAHLTGSFAWIEELVSNAADVISHVHISEPFLDLAPAEPTATARTLRSLRTVGYAQAVSIEMRGLNNGLATLDNALYNLALAQELSVMPVEKGQ